MTLDTLDLPQQGHPLPGVISAGQPSAAELAAAKAAGIRRVINLRPPSEAAGFDEAATLADLGLSYTVIPVAGPEDLTLATVKALDEALAAGEGPVLLHCASANRVGALLALRAAWLQGLPAQEALALGEAGGLTRMAPMVAELLRRGPA
jgi:uncharacterized protein (TIGR01244 family)